MGDETWGVGGLSTRTLCSTTTHENKAFRRGHAVFPGEPHQERGYYKAAWIGSLPFRDYATVFSITCLSMIDASKDTRIARGGGQPYGVP